MVDQNAQPNVCVEFVRETKNPETEVSTYWFKAQVSAREWPDLFIGLSRKGDVMNCSLPYFNIDTTTRNKILSEVRNLQRMMK